MNVFIFSVKSSSIAQRSVPQEIAFKKSGNHWHFRKTIGSNNYVALIKTIAAFKIAKFEFKVTVHHGLWTKWK